jgi:hypothetical protein
MLSQQQVDNLLFHNHHYFDTEEVLSSFSREELDNILIHLENLSEIYFKRIMELSNDPYERSDKATARIVMNNAYNQVYNYNLNRIPNKPSIRANNSYYSGSLLIIIYIIIFLGILLYFII